MTDYTQHFGDGGLNENVDADDVADRLGLDADDIAWRKEFIDFDAEDAARLERFETPFREHADEIAASFYDNILAYDATTEVVDRSPRDVDALERTQKAYLVTLADGEYDVDYFRNRARIGKIHDLLDMPIKHYLGQYNVYYELLLPLVTDRIHDRLGDTVETVLDRHDDADSLDVDPDRFTRRLYEDVEAGIDELHSLLKILNLDMQVAVETYLQSRLNETRAERDRFAALFENVPTPVVVVRIGNEGMQVEQVNGAFEKMFGYVASDLTDRNFEELLRPPGEEPKPIEDRNFISDVGATSESELSEAEVTLETQFGRRDFIRVSAPVDRAGLEDLEYAFYIDVTDQKQRQERLQVLSRVLRHNLRNRMTVIQGCLDCLRHPSRDGTREEALAMMDAAADKLIAESDRIREVEKLVAGTADRRPVNVAALLEAIVEARRGEYPECEFSLSAPGRMWVKGTDALRVALADVIENAAEHNDATEPFVDVSAVESLDSEYVNVRVADNGPGIPPEEYEILTGERDRSQTQHSSGLGLWTVNWVATKIGGGLQFDANSPRGSIVTLQLPRADPPE